MSLDDYQQAVMRLHGIAGATPSADQDTVVNLVRFLGTQFETLAFVCAKHGLSLASVVEIETRRVQALAKQGTP